MQKQSPGLINYDSFKDEFKLNKIGFDPNLPGHSTRHPNPMVLRQSPRTVRVEGSGISLQQSVRLEMGLMLDEHLCALNVALHQYTKHYWLAEGAESCGSLHHVWSEQVKKTIEHIDELGKRITRLGVVPTAHPLTQHELSYIKHEVEGRYAIRDFIRNDLEHELKIQDMLRKTIQRASGLLDYGTAQALTSILLAREKIGHQLWCLLEDDSLVRGLNQPLH